MQLKLKLTFIFSLLFSLLISLISLSSFAADIKDNEPLFKMTKVACLEDQDPKSYNKLFCASFSWFVNEDDFKARIKKCNAVDPLKRTTIKEYLTNMNCESRYIDQLKNHLQKNGLLNYKGRTVTSLSALIMDSDNVMRTTGLIHSQIRHYRRLGKNNGYPELKEFAATMNRLDENGHTFLDNVMMRFNDEFVTKVGLGIKNVRKRLIVVSCKIGGKFTNPEHTKRFNCKADPKYTN